MKTMLVVDDSEFMRSLIKRHVSELDVSIIGEAEDGKVAIEKFIELSPDIVTLDLAMFELDGIDALEAMMRHNPEARVLIVSSTAGQQVVVDRAMQLGARGVVTKPIEKDVLVSHVKKLLDE